MYKEEFRPIEELEIWVQIELESFKIATTFCRTAYGRSYPLRAVTVKIHECGRETITGLAYR